MADPKIFIRRSATPNKVPTTNQLALGELAINTYDGKLYLEKDPGGVGVGTTVIAVNPWTVGVGSLAYDTYFTAGNVGINSTSPTATLDVNGTLNVSGFSTFQDHISIPRGKQIYDEIGNQIIFFNNTEIQVWNRNLTVFHRDFYVENIFNNNYPFYVDNSQSSAPSKVGINSSTPRAELDVRGNVIVSGVVTATEFHGNGSNITGIVSISDSSPTSPQAGDLWWESDTGDLKVYYDESKVGAGTSAFWVSTNGADTTVAISTDAPSPATSGDLWWDSIQGNLFVYYDDGDSAQWVDATGLSGTYPWVITGAGIHTTSKVGIGTDTNLTAKLTVGNIENGVVADKGATAFKTLASTGGVGESAIYIEEQSGSEGWYLKVNSSGDLQLNDSGVSDRITFQDGGNVGINSTAPTAKLDVVGDAKIGIDTSQGVILTSPNGTEYRLIVDNSGNLSTVAV